MPNFAAFTFPSCSSAVSALQYAADPSVDDAAPRTLLTPVRVLLLAYSATLSTFVVLVVLLVVVGFVTYVCTHDSDGKPYPARARTVAGVSITKGPVLDCVLRPASA